MSEYPEWRDETAPAEAVRISERDQLVESLSIVLHSIKGSIETVRQQLIKLDEMGEAVSRSKTRAAKVDECVVDLIAHFDHDVIKRMSLGTKEQQARRETYELS